MSVTLFVCSNSSSVLLSCADAPGRMHAAAQGGSSAADRDAAALPCVLHAVGVGGVHPSWRRTPQGRVRRPQRQCCSVSSAGRHSGPAAAAITRGAVAAFQAGWLKHTASVKLT